jgi:hypothetical protein
MKNKNVETRNRGNGPRLLPLAAALIAAFSVLHGAAPAHAQSIVVTGDVSPGMPSPTATNWVVDGGLFVGMNGVGTMRISNGATVSSDSGHLGSFPSGNATVDV